MSERGEIDMRVGRRAGDGSLSLSTLTPQLLTLKVSYKSERGVTVQLTREQVGELRAALTELETQLEAEASSGTPWDGGERRQES